jgi:hypothetical protein
MPTLLVLLLIVHVQSSHTLQIMELSKYYCGTVRKYIEIVFKYDNNSYEMNKTVF